MVITENASLIPYNTFGIEAKADFLIQYDSVADLQHVLQMEIVQANPILHVGSGSNLLFLSDYKGIILHSEICFVDKVGETDDTISLEAGAGIVWDDFVAYCVSQNLGGVENLSLIPGEVGASAVQNIGAYGVEACDLISEVKTVEISTGNVRIFTQEECRYGYRYSVFKDALKGQYIVTSVVFNLQKIPAFKLDYQHLEAEVLKSGPITLASIRDTIISVRESKLPDPKIAGNAGSFFMNPVVSKKSFYELQSRYPDMPHYFVSDSEEKIPAGWLIDQCGWKGKQIGNAGVHDKQALVLVNKGGASGAEIVHLANEIQESVFKKFGIAIHPEVNYI